MFALLEGLWYALLILLKVCFWPAIILVGIALIARLYGKTKKAIKDSKDEKK